MVLKMYFFHGSSYSANEKQVYGAKILVDFFLKNTNSTYALYFHN
jgi:subtilase family serine protease